VKRTNLSSVNRCCRLARRSRDSARAVGDSKRGSFGDCEGTSATISGGQADHAQLTSVGLAVGNNGGRGRAVGGVAGHHGGSPVVRCRRRRRDTGSVRVVAEALRILSRAVGLVGVGRSAASVDSRIARCGRVASRSWGGGRHTSSAGSAGTTSNGGGIADQEAGAGRGSIGGVRVVAKAGSVLGGAVGLVGVGRSAAGVGSSITSSNCGIASGVSRSRYGGRGGRAIASLSGDRSSEAEDGNECVVHVCE